MTTCQRRFNVTCFHVHAIVSIIYRIPIMLVFDEKYEKKHKNIQEKTRNAIFTILEYRTLMFKQEEEYEKL